MKKEQLLLAALGIIFLILLLSTSGCLTKKTTLQDRFATRGNDDNTNTDNTGTGDNGLTDDQTAVQDIANLVDECLLENNDAKADSCLIELAKDKKNDIPCEKIVLLSKDRCYLEVGVLSEDDSICGKIEVITVREECLSEVGLETNNASTCAKIISSQEKRDECYDNSGRINKASDTCANIFNSTTRDGCYISVAGSTSDYSFCNSVSLRKTSEGIQRDLCYEASGEQLNGEICATIVSEEFRAECFQDATNTPSVRIDCNSFEDTNSINNCTNWYASYSGDITLCYDLESDEIEACLIESITTNPNVYNCGEIQNAHYKVRNDCYKETAISELDENICQSITGNSRLKKECVKEIAIAKEDVDLCFGLNTGDKDDCISKIAAQTNDFTLCEKISTDRAYFKCYVNIALGFDAPEICEKAERSELRIHPYTGMEHCYKEYAIQTQDTEICDRITYSFFTQECKDAVEVELVCQDFDGVCDRNYCNIENDVDCIRGFSCQSNSDCNDNKVSTNDSCNTTTKICTYTPIEGCINNDNYCSTQCTFIGDPDAIIQDPNTGETNEDDDCIDPNELCLTDANCDDSDISTIDTCNTTTELCTHATITQCTDDDNYCPSTCTFVGDPDANGNEDNDCLEPIPTCMLATITALYWPVCQSYAYDATICEPSSWSVVAEGETCTTDYELRELCYIVPGDQLLSPENNSTFTETC
tara:strand:+ start:2125 stop:4245 length:2121 start_codon:yes stop_codon:yes gene_type:complete